MLSNTLIKESLIGLKSERVHARREDITKKLRYYAGQSTDIYIRDYFNKDTLKETVVANFNYTSRFIDKISRTYQSGIIRTVNEKYKKMTRKKDLAMKHCEKATNLVGSPTTLVKLKENRRGYYYDYRTIYDYVPFFGDDPYVPIALSYRVTLPVSDPTNVEDTGWVYYDKEVEKVFDENGEQISERVHNLGILPFVFTHKDHQLGEFFVEGASDIIDANENTNLLMTELAIGSRYQLWGQPWYSGAHQDDKKTVRMGVENVVGVEEGSAFGIAAPGGDLHASIELVKFGIELCGQNNHLWVTWNEQGGEVPSGIAIMIRDLERHEDYVDRIERWREYEQNYYDIEKRLAEVNGITLPDEIGLDFIEPEYPLTTQDQILWDEHRLRHNLATEAELTLEYNKDLMNIKNAKKEWQKRKTVNDQNNVLIQQIKPPTTKVDNRIDQQGG